MRQRRHALILGTALLLLGWVAIAQGQSFSSGSTGADGPFAPTSNTTLTLPASGVFNFTTITIPSGVTVTIGRNATNTPATLLAQGDVTIAGILDLSGQAGGGGMAGTATASNGGLPGPGGGAGGSGSTGAVSSTGGAGQGPGGGSPGVPDGGSPPHCSGAGGGHNGAGGNGTNGSGGATCAPTGGPSYGSSRLLPLLGGSGGGGGSSYFGYTAGGGGGGGGALLLASSTKITLAGTIRANGNAGGSGTNGSGAGGGGSGGAVRLVAPLLTGSGGNLQVAGGNGGSPGCVPVWINYVCAGGAGSGTPGRIRLEATTFGLTATMTVAPSQGPLGTLTLASAPSLRFTSVAGVAAPASPQGSYGTPDLTLPAGFTNPGTITLAAAQIPVGTVVTVRSIPLQGSASSTTGSLTGTAEASAASVTLTLPTNQPTLLSAEATFALTASAGSGPLYAEGEELTHIRVAAVFGGPSVVTYITRSGREIALP